MGHAYTNPRPSQHLTHAHSHITRAVAVMDSCFALIKAHQHGIAVGPLYGKSRSKPVKYVYVCPLLKVLFFL